MQRLVVAEFRDGDVGQQTRSGQPALDGQRGHRRLHDGLAGAAAQLRPDVLDHLEAGGDIFEQLALVLADAAEDGAAATGTGTGGFVDDGLAREVLGQFGAAGTLARSRPSARELLAIRIRRSGGIGIPSARLFLGRLLLEFADQQLQLLDVAVELLGGAAEPRPAQHGQLHLQLLDVQRLGVDLCRIGGDLQLLARQLRLQPRGQCPQGGGIGG